VSLSRRELLQLAAVAAVSSFGRVGAAQAPPAASVAFTALRRDVGIFIGRGGTIGWLITPDAVVVIDSQFRDTAEACLEGVKSRATHPIDFLVNTHHHPDHTSGNTVFQPAVKHIVAHRNVPPLQKRSAEQQNTADTQAYADMLYDTNWSQPVGRETLRIHHFGPAHTSGDSVVTFVNANVAHMGDLVFRQRHPVVDRSAGGTIKNWISVLEAVERAHDHDTIYVFGHAREGAGTSGTSADLHAMRDYLTAALDVVQKNIAAGKSRDEITAIASLARFEEYQSVPPRGTLANILGAAYDESAGK
jgi:glyoxylase-like metal-dependent hydrolase (beta-lactamase superfamily II)